MDQSEVAAGHLAAIVSPTVGSGATGVDVRHSAVPRVCNKRLGFTLPRKLYGAVR